MDNNYIDKAVREAVGDYEVDFTTPDWEEMESRLDQDNALRRKLYLTKAVEVCLVLLAIWTVIPFLESEPPHTTTPPSDATTPVATPVEPLPTDEPIAALSVSAVTSDESAPTASAPAYARTTRVATPAPTLVPPTQDRNPAFAANVGEPMEQASSVTDAQDEPSDVWYMRDAVAATTLPAATPHEWYTPQETPSRYRWEQRRVAPANAAALSPSREPIAALRRPSAIKKQNTIAPHSRLSIGAMTATEWLNIQETPMVALSRKARRINPAMGIVANFAATERLNIEGGLMATQRQQVERRFEPMPYNKGIVGERNSIKTTAVELQTNVSYNFGQLGKTKLFAMAGLSNYLALMSDQRLMEKNLFASANFDASTVATAPTSGSNVGAATTERIAGTMPNDLGHRHQLSLNLGMSAEIALTDKWTLFARMLYKNGLTTVGPFEDQVSALNMGAGVRTQL